MNFAFLTDEGTLSFYPIDKVESLYIPIQSIEGASYIVTEQYGVDINETLTAERVNDDLHLKFYADSQTPSAIVIKDFALTNGKIFSLADNGEYRQHLTVEDMPLQGPVTLTNFYLGTQQEQPEAVSLKVIQHAATLQTFETLGESLNPSSDVFPAQPEVTAFSEEKPLLAASLEANTPFNAIPSITNVFDQVGLRQGNLVSGSVTDDKQPKLVGTGRPGAQLEIFQNGELIGLAPVDSATGAWSFIPSVPLQEGGQLFYVRDPQTNQTSANIVLIVDTVAPSRSTISSVVAGDTDATTAISQNGYTNDNTPTLSGKGEANCLIAIYNGNALVGTTYANNSGEWSFTPISPLQDGKYEFKAAGTDFSGNVGLSSAKFIFTIDTVPPTQPKITELIDNVGAVTGPVLNGATTDDNTPTLKGLGEAGRKVTLYDNGEKIGETTVDKDGNWEFTPETALSEDQHEFSVIIEDLAGNKSKPSEPWVVVVDTMSPAAPSIVSVYDNVGNITGELLQSGSATDDTTPTLKGQSVKGAKVEIFDNGTKIGETTAKEDGSWEFTPESELAEGEHSFTARATNASGKVSDLSQPWALVIDTTAPEQPGIDGNGAGISEVLDDQGTVTGPISNGGTTDDTKPTLNGKGEPGDTIIITDNGNKIGEVIVDKDGKWEFTPETDLNEGEHKLSVIIQDPVGNQSKPSDPWVVIVDTTPPATPSIGSVYDNAGNITGDLKPGAATDDTTPTLKGQAEAGAKVEIFDNGTKIGETTAKEDGSWEFTPENELTEGDHSFTIRATDVAGNASELSEPWALVIDTTAPEQPGIDGNGAGISEVLDDQGTVTGPISNGGTTDDTKPTLNGKGEPGDTIIITDNGNKIGEVIVDKDGKWEFTPETDLSEGEHKLSVIIQDPVGNQSKPSDPWVVIVDTTPPATPSIGSVYDNAGNITGDLKPGAATDDTTPTLKGQAEAGAKVEIFDNGTKIGETTAKEDGSWEFTPENELTEGDHSFTIRATDVAGNASELSEPWALVIDTTAPEQPGIDGNGAGISEVLDDQGTVTGPISNGGTTDDTKPTLNGKGEPGDTIIITDNGNKIGEVIVDKDGKWEFTPETDLSEGEHKLSVIIQDPVGNQSKPSDPWVVIVDTTPPVAPTIDSIYDNAGEKTGFLTPNDTTDDTTPTLKGQAEAGTKVEIFDKGTKIGETTAKEDGSWEFTPENELAEGAHSFTVEATDIAGNRSDASEAWPARIIVKLPETPVIESVMDDAGSVTGKLASGDLTDDRRPEISGSGEADVTVIVYDRGIEIGRAKADENGDWSFTPQSDLKDGEYSFTVVAENSVGSKSVASDPFELIVYTGNGPTQFARVSQMGKDSGYDGNDFVSDNGNAGRLMYGKLSAELAAGQTLQVSTDGGKNWFDALVDGTKWAAQDLNEHAASWNIQTRVVDQLGNPGYVTSQAVTLDIVASRAPASVSLQGTNLLVGFDPANVVVGERIAVVADGGTHRFEHTLTEQDIAAGSVTLDVGTVSNASVALVDLAGNLSNFTTTSGSAPGVNMTVTGDVSEIYGQNRDNIFTVADVDVLNNVKVIEGNGGVDVLKLTGADQVLDLSAWSGRLSSVEVIDITGSGNNTLKLSLGDVLDQGFRGAFINDESVQLAVKGNAGDVVMLNDLLPNGMDVGDWESLGEVVSAGISYEVYHHTGMEAELLVQQGVTVQFS
ncbi:MULTISPECIES: Ig-like domain repeat protein [unclassified Serratia (in: enterobacteria)]|uniref:Ig-like domain repeat protein n=1 Tax=unclassified Serratia (in: enterobacteria) TaxID=2647522 RepID=UPI00050831C5|nr:MULTISPECIES: Ig-like domain repeat protein [unclassified Serratia (in: enterobacteria)]KFK94905.1 hypothetical protein JV45_09765 [Serratia sp. Ag2]KFK97032.1 hypothetical protein IV04_17125 [Serratia sp. Ag1]